MKDEILQKAKNIINLSCDKSQLSTVQWSTVHKKNIILVKSKVLWSDKQSSMYKNVIIHRNLN